MIGPRVAGQGRSRGVVMGGSGCFGGWCNCNGGDIGNAVNNKVQWVLGGFYTPYDKYALLKKFHEKQ